MITLHLTDEEAYNYRAALRIIAGSKNDRLTRELCQELADRIQEQQQLTLGGWHEDPGEGHSETRQEMQDKLPSIQYFYPKHRFKVARSLVYPGEWTFWTKGDTEDAN